MQHLQLDQEEAAFLQEQLQASTDDGLYTGQGIEQEQDEGQGDECLAPDSLEHSSTEHDVEDEKMPWNLDAPTAWNPADSQQQKGVLSGEQGPGEAHSVADEGERSSEVAEELQEEEEEEQQQQEVEEQQQVQALQQVHHHQLQQQQQEQQQHQVQQHHQEQQRQQQQQHHVQNLQEHLDARGQMHTQPGAAPETELSDFQHQEPDANMHDGSPSGSKLSRGRRHAPASAPSGRTQPVYVVAPPALMLDPALDPRDVVGMTGQRNPQPCPHRHARKLASTIELEQQLAAVFEEGDEGEEATALKVDIVEALCRKYNRTAMSLLETRSYAQAGELLQKAQVLCEEDGVLAAHPSLRMRLQSVTLNNLGCYYCRRCKIPAALRALEAAVGLEQEAAAKEQEQGQGQEQVTWGSWGDLNDVSEDPSGTLLNLCAVLGMLGRHTEALQRAKDAAQMICMANSLDQGEVEAWCCAYAPPQLPPYMPHAKFGHDPKSGRPFCARFPPPPPPPPQTSPPMSFRCAQPSPNPSTAPQNPPLFSSRSISSPTLTSPEFENPSQSMRARNKRPSPLGLSPSPSLRTRTPSPTTPSVQSQYQSFYRLHFRAEHAQAELHNPQQHHPPHSHSHHLQEFGGRTATPPLPPNSVVDAYKKYYLERRKQRASENSIYSALPSLASPPTCPSPFGLPQTPLSPDAPRAAHVLRTMPPARVNLLVMAYFSQGVQQEHLNNLHDAFRAYALASSLPARVFGRSSHLAVRFNKSFHAFKLKHSRYFSQRQEQEQREARQLCVCKRHGSLAALLGVNHVCHPPPENLVRKQILDSYAQEYELAPPQPQPIPSSVKLMMAHKEKLQAMKKGKLVFF
ncbi:hypothetical protein DUNSADRAFT_13908 [Dunaliella salina]|uniref:Uncharacterized protein n=1 Tax=Dunaliella salina TaxID=3046 RepID=A0ABQ7G8J3_DUNSA|nr:hypothetical protein DUNSADRAFT_13908 [Dunaliella salina]|eukprot:KAF5830898.1 hypothetical protein DUNSADRAFT_13908 [Dunaliella salina]